MSQTQATQVAMTGVAIQLPNIPFSNQYVGATLRAKVGNAASIVLGNTSAVTASTGFILEAGAQISMALVNANQLWAIGTSADVLSIAGS